MLSLLFVTEFSKIYIAIFLILKFNKKRSIAFLTTVATISFLVIDVGRIMYFGDITEFALDSFIFLAVSLFIMAYAMGTIKQLILLVGVYLVVSFINLLIAGVVVSITPLTMSIVQLNFIYITIINLVGVAFFLVLAFLLRRFKFEERIKFFRNSEILLVIFVIILASFTITLLQRQGEDTVEYSSIFILLATLGGIAIIVSVLMLVIKLNEVREIKQVQEIQNILVKQQQKYYDNLLKQDQETRKFRHDINEHFQCISMLTKLEKIPELQEYVSGLIGKFDIIKSDLKTDTGAEIVNVILYDLELQYESLGIEIRWEGAIPSHTKIAINDTSTLFSNLLKNSFEAAVKCEENKFIKVQTRSDRTNFYVMVENSYSGDELITNNKQKTSKRDKLNHGYGLTIIREIVEKYNGIMIVSGENNVHKVEIILKDVLDLKIN